MIFIYFLLVLWGIGMLGILTFYLVEYFVLPKIENGPFYKWWRENMIDGDDLEPLEWFPQSSYVVIHLFSWVDSYLHV